MLRLFAGLSLFHCLVLNITVARPSTPRLLNGVSCKPPVAFEVYRQNAGGDQLTKTPPCNRSGLFRNRMYRVFMTDCSTLPVSLPIIHP